jgi:3'-5' exoribonuclease
MKSPFVRELKPDEISTAVFLVSTKEVRQKRSGEPYLSLVLSDRTGEIDSKMWDNVGEIVETFERDDFVKVKGLMQLYNNRPQFTIHKLRRMEDHEVDFRDFFPASGQDAEAMWKELREMVCAIRNSHLRGLVNAFLDDPEVASRFQVAPAAKNIHHAFRSGLLEHVLSLMKLGAALAAHYCAIQPGAVDVDLLYAGIVLHDIGKIYELTYDRGFGYSAEGQLLGHIAIGLRMIEEKLRAFPDFPLELRNVIEHMVLSHHGQLEFGSPRTPMFPEALLLHYIDDMDSKMENMRALIERDPQSVGYFTSYSPALARVALRRTRYLERDPGGTLPTAPNGPVGLRAAAAPENDIHNGGNHSETASNSNTPVHHSSVHPGGAPAASPNSISAPVAQSQFGAKLQQALDDERK